MTIAVKAVTGPLVVHMVERVPLNEGEFDSLQKLVDWFAVSLVGEPEMMPPRGRGDCRANRW
jgi:hypothetical protein